MVIASTLLNGLGMYGIMVVWWKVWCMLSRWKEGVHKRVSEALATGFDWLVCCAWLSTNWHHTFSLLLCIQDGVVAMLI